MMNIAEFEKRLDRYGDVWSEWPAELRAEAMALVFSSPDAQTLLASYRQFDALFSGFDVPAAPAEDLLVATALAIPRQQPVKLLDRVLQSLRSGGWMDFGWAHTAGLASCVLLGFTIGVVEPSYHAKSSNLYDLSDTTIAGQIDE